MRFIGLLSLLLSLLMSVSAPTYADPLTQSNPLTDCLNNYILPQMGSNAAPEEIVDRAFLLCRPYVDSWLAAASDSRRPQLERALRQFYLDRLNAALYRSTR